MRKSFFIVMVVLLSSSFLFGEVLHFDGSWGRNPLFNMVYESPSGVELIFSMHEMVIAEMQIDGVEMKSFGVPGVFIPEEGTPNLTGVSRYIAIPQGSQVRVTILGSRTEVYHNVEVAPAPNIPLESDKSPLRYEKDMSIYGRNAYYPESPVRLSEPMKMRGVDVVIAGVMPFQFNPVTKELIVYKDIRFRIDFIDGNGHFGEDRLRSRFWEPILQGHLLNYNSLPKIDFYAPERIMSRDGYEYIIIVPDDPAYFEAWGDTIKAWRKLQGISCDVFTLTEVGGTSASAIESFLNNAYNTWDPAPVAFLLLSDYPSSGDLYGITSPKWNNYCVSDNIYADVNGDDLPDMHHARITAQDYSDLETMINKFLSYERAPYTSFDFYDNPLVACGWQDDRWFQMCAETVRNFFIDGLDKDPARQYNLGSPANPLVGGFWTTRSGSNSVIQYWVNAGWLPGMTNPYNASWWDNGSASGINAAINSGAFFLQHRDHGSETGWGEPSYHSSDLNNLTNTEYVYVNSTNCLTGKYNYAGEVFAEKFHRIDYGALGLNAASEVSYSFVNDTYVWGMIDFYWPSFDENYPIADLIGANNLRPSMAMSSGKYYLQGTWFPDAVGAGGSRVVTYHLFHHLGDAFTTLYSEVPENLSVSHPDVLYSNQSLFPVSANNSSVIALTVNGEIIAVAEGTGSTVSIPIPAQSPPDTMKVTVTKENYYRYEKDVPIINSNAPYVGYLKSIIDDGVGGNGDGLANPGESIDWEIWVKNFSSNNAFSVYGILSISDPYINISSDSSWFGNVAAGDSSLGSIPYSFSISNNCPDGYVATYDLSVHDVNDTVRISHPLIEVFAPALTLESFVIDGAGNGKLDPGETADIVLTIKNDGSIDALSVTGYLYENSPYVSVPDPNSNFGNIVSGASVDNAADPFTVQANSQMPTGEMITFKLVLTSGVYCDTLEFGRMHYLIWDFDPNQSSGPIIDAALQGGGYVGDYSLTLPISDLNNYMAIFVCAGIFGDNSVIGDSSTEALELINFVNNGGRMYLEGGNVWFYDPQYGGGFDFGPLFGINGTDVGFGDLATINGQNGVFTQGMSFAYNGENAWIDHIEPTGTGFLIFENSSPVYGCGVANDAGTYKTVGVSFEFGGLTDGSPPSTKEALADSIMKFFGMAVGVEEKPMSSLHLPKVYGLSNSYPNPCCNNVVINYQIPRKGKVSFKVYDVSGRLTDVLIDGVVEPGYYSLRLDTKGYASGVYFYRLAGGGKTFTRKLIVVK